MGKLRFDWKILALGLMLALGGWSQSTYALVISVMKYNVENLFDTENDPRYRDDDFTPEGRFAWTEERLVEKMENLAEVVTSVENDHGRPCPDILGLSEVENRAVLERWRDEHLAACEYRHLVIHTPHPDEPRDDDPRGIRVALFSRLSLAAQPSMYQPYFGARYILEVPLQLKDQNLLVFISHWRSRLRGGEEQRAQYAGMIRDRLKEINKMYPNLDYVVMGDFNDEPEDDSLKKVLQVSHRFDDRYYNPDQYFLWNTSYNLFHLPSMLELAKDLGYDVEETERRLRAQRGSFYFARERRFNQLDHLLLSRGLFQAQGFQYVVNSFEVYRHPRFTTPENTPLAYRPSQDGVEGGASDHFPVLMNLRLVEN